MRTRLAVAAAGLGLFLMGTGVSVLAHHAFAAEFDANKPVNFKGTVTKMEWTNPHSWIRMNVKGTDGTVTEWAIECGPPNNLLRQGFNKTTVPAGMEIVVDGYRAKNGSPMANGREVTTPDGKKLFVGSAAGAGAPY